jgi:hypothetical protein
MRSPYATTEMARRLAICCRTKTIPALRAGGAFRQHDEMPPNQEAHSGPRFRSKLFDELPPEEREAAEERFRQYLDLALRIFTRLEHDPEAYARFEALTDRAYRSNMNERSNISPSNTNSQ